VQQSGLLFDLFSCAGFLLGIWGCAAEWTYLCARGAGNVLAVWDKWQQWFEYQQWQQSTWLLRLSLLITTN
jgi:hypothetical protein